tara:strand:+ start:5301 stop:6632 length:1332 start_codon:yes stop_codon:yes gene_type:complete
MIMKYVLILCLVLSNFVLAQDFTRGVGYFYAHSGDRHEFIKKQLVYEGFKNIISKELEKMGLNKEVFWKKYEAMLNEEFDKIESDLRSKLNITAKSSAAQKNRFKQALREKKLNYRLGFGDLNTIINRYSIKKLSRSQKNANSRSINLEGAVDKNKLTKVYYDFVSDSKRSEYGSLYLNINYILEDITYTELGIENEKDFSNVIKSKWIEWFNKNKPGNISKITELAGKDQAKLNDYLKLPANKMLSNIPPMFVNSLLLDLEVKIERVKYDKRKNEYEFRYSGAGYLKELQTNLVVDTYEFSEELKKYSLNDDISLANIIVNHVYRMALGSFPQIVSSIKNITNINSIQNLEIINYDNMYQVVSLVDDIQSKGIRYSLRTHISHFGKNKAEVVLFFDGKESDIKALLRSLQAAKKDQSFELVDSDNAIRLKFIQNVKEPAKKI